jgi:parallel beta-helix repeat protein
MIFPAQSAVAPGNVVKFDVLQGSPRLRPTWAVQEPGGGTIDANGVYTAPAGQGTYHVVATSTADPTKSDQATVTVTGSPQTSSPTQTAVPTPTGPQFYVATNGDDSNPGTIDQPWRTIQKAMNSATAGSTVNIRAGTYNERLTLNVSGNSGNYITFQPYGFSVPSGGCGGYTGAACGGDQVVLDYAYLGTVTDGVPFLEISGQSYVRIQGLTFQNFTCYGAMQQGLRIDGASSFIDVSRNKFLQNKNTYPNFDGTAALLHVRVWGPSHDVLLYGNELGFIDTVQSEAVTVDGASSVTIQDNYLHDTDGIGIDLHGSASNCTVRGNLLEWISKKRDGTIWYSTPANAIYVDGGNTSLIEGNTVRDSEWAFAVCAEPNQPASHDITVRNNVVYRCYGGLFAGNWYSSTNGSNVYDVKYLNNTVYSSDQGMVIRPYTSASVEWKNNAIVNTALPVVNGLGWPVGTMDYNLYFGGGAAGPDAHQVTADPQFTNPGAGDFSLGVGSPAIGAAAASVGADAGASDFLGNPRFVNGRLDIGAYEAQ